MSGDVRRSPAQYAETVDRLVAGIDAPMAPTTALEARVRASLTDERHVDDDAGSAAAPRSGGRVLVAAAAVLFLLVAASSMLWTGDGDEQVTADATDDSALSAPGTTGRHAVADELDLEPLDVAAARAACTAFAGAAFGDLTRTQVVGPNNSATLTSAEALSTATATLQSSFAELRRELADAGLDDAEVDQHADRVETRLVRAAASVEAGRLTFAQTELGRIDELLIHIDRRLTEGGVTQCL